jgi:predicted PurR-regulated permease PerM
MSTLTKYQQACLTVILTGVVILILHQVCVLLSIPGGKVLTMVIATVFLAAGLRRPVNYLERSLKIPRVLTIALIYLGFFALCTVASVQVVPIVAQQAQDIASAIQQHWVPPKQLIAMLPRGARDLIPEWMVDELFTFVQAKVFALVGSIDAFAGTMSSVIGQVLAMGFELVLVLILAFLVVREEGVIAQYVTAPIADPQRKQRVQDCIDHTMTDLGQWANAQLLIGAFFGVGFGGCLWLFGLPYACTIGLVGLMLEAVVPMAGGLVALVLAVAVGLSSSLLWGPVGAVGAYGIAFVAEWHLAYPLTIGRALNIPALASILALWIGYYPLGLLGSVLVLPCLVILGNIAQFVWPHAFPAHGQAEPAHHRLFQAVWRWRTRLVVSRTTHTLADPAASVTCSEPSDVGGART